MMVLYISFIYANVCTCCCFYAYLYHCPIGNKKVLFIIFAIFFTGIARSFTVLFIWISSPTPSSRNVPKCCYLVECCVWQSGAVLDPAFGGILLGKLGITNAFIIIIIFGHCYILLLKLKRNQYNMYQKRGKYFLKVYHKD